MTMHLRMFLGVLRTHTLRLTLTCLSLAAAFLLFGVLQGANDTLASTAKTYRTDTLIVLPRLDAPLLRAYADRILKIPGAKDIVWSQAMFTNLSARVAFPMIFVDPDRLLAVRPEYRASPGGLEALHKNPTGILVFDTLAKKTGVKLGDHIELPGTPRKDGKATWGLDVVGFLTQPDNPNHADFAIGNFSMFDEARGADNGTVQRFSVLLDDPKHSASVAKAIDNMFANSPAPTRSEAENQYNQALVGLLGDIGGLFDGVVLAVFLAMVIVTANVLIQSVLDRDAEFAVLRAVGYSRARIGTIVFFEALVCCVIGALAGMAVAGYVYPQAAQMFNRVAIPISAEHLPWATLVKGTVFAIALAAASVLIPQLKINRMRPQLVLNSRV